VRTVRPALDRASGRGSKSFAISVPDEPSSSVDAAARARQQSASMSDTSPFHDEADVCATSAARDDLRNYGEVDVELLPLAVAEVSLDQAPSFATSVPYVRLVHTDDAGDDRCRR